MTDLSAARERAAQLVAEIAKTLPWEEQGFPRWAFGDGDPDAKWVIGRYQALRLLQALADRVEALQREHAEYVTGHRDQVAEDASTIGDLQRDLLAAEERVEAAEKDEARHAEVVADYVAQLDELDGERFSVEARVVELEEALDTAIGYLDEYVSMDDETMNPLRAALSPVSPDVEALPDKETK